MPTPPPAHDHRSSSAFAIFRWPRSPDGRPSLGRHTYGTDAAIRQDRGLVCLSHLWNPQHKAFYLQECRQSRCPGKKDSLSLEENTAVKHERRGWGAGLQMDHSPQEVGLACEDPPTHTTAK